MINKRLLVKNLLAHNDESSFYDKKRQLNLHSREGKAKFLKHICALSNSNPGNNSYIVVGVEDGDNAIVGEDFFDDSKIQNLVNAYLEHPPQIQYENVPFPTLPKDKVIGLVTIRPRAEISYFKKGIHTISARTIFARNGSNSVPCDVLPNLNYANVDAVSGIEKSSRNSIAHTLDGVVDFLNNRHKELSPKYKVFKELFVICWAGTHKTIRQQVYLSRVDIEMINEQVKLFYSAQDDVTIEFDDDSFTITEYLKLGLNDRTSYYAFERKTLHFFDNGYYKIETEMLFEPPVYSKKMLFHIYNSNLALLKKLNSKIPLNSREFQDLENLPSTFMICYLNGFDDAKQRLIDSKVTLKSVANSTVYVSFKEAMRILRKLKYDGIFKID